MAVFMDPAECREAKRRLRAEIRTRERALSEDYKTRADRGILERLRELSIYQAARTVCCYVGTEREINTRPILRDVLNSGKRLCVPLCVTPGYMEMRRTMSLGELSPGTMGIWEPAVDAPLISPVEIDLLLAPCVTCDAHGWRLGYGGGYYDRYLVDYPGAAMVLCRERLMCVEIPHGAYDIRPGPVLTEKGLYTDDGGSMTPE